MPKILTPALLLALLFAPAGCDSEDDDAPAETDGDTEADGDTETDGDTADGRPLGPATSHSVPTPEPDPDDDLKGR